MLETDQLCAAGTGQQGKDRDQTPLDTHESAGAVQRGNRNVSRERSRLAGLQGLTLLPK